MSENQKPTEEHCPCCHRHCPADALRCPRGEAFYRGEGEEAQAPPATPEEKLMEQFHNCARFLQHHVHTKRGQQRILSILHERQGITQRALMDIVDVSAATLSELLGKIEADGYITRSKNEQDKRNVDVVLTEAGKEAASHMQSRRSASVKELFGTLSAEEQAQLSALLAKLTAQWEPGERHGHHDHHGEQDGHGHGRHHEGERHFRNF
ncbi:MAG: MarR family transcriptional regulator [Oscillospiraceae bacterium]|jgi:DNA-binding MarR family transcriptional regulator|nr:MarR family transcriptional regulator [Oscillospiraceae bacterium]